MKKLPLMLKQRKNNAKILTELLSNNKIILPQPRKNETVNWYLFTIAIKNRAKIMKKLNSAGITSAVYYDPPIHKTSYYKTQKKLPNTEWAASNVLSLPVHPNVKKVDLQKMRKILEN